MLKAAGFLTKTAGQTVDKVIFLGTFTMLNVGAVINRPRAFRTNDAQKTGNILRFSAKSNNYQGIAWRAINDRPYNMIARSCLFDTLKSRRLSDENRRPDCRQSNFS